MKPNTLLVLSACPTEPTLIGSISVDKQNILFYNTPIVIMPGQELVIKRDPCTVVVYHRVQESFAKRLKRWFSRFIRFP